MTLSFHHGIKFINLVLWECWWLVLQPQERWIKGGGLEKVSSCCHLRVKDDLFHSETCARVATKPHRAKGNSICHGFVKSYRSGKMLILVGLWPYCLSIFHVVISAGTLAAKYTGPRLIVLIPVFELRSIYTPEQTRRARSHFPNSSAPGCLIFKYHRNSYWFYLVSQWILT